MHGDEIIHQEAVTVDEVKAPNTLLNMTHTSKHNAEPEAAWDTQVSV